MFGRVFLALIYSGIKLSAHESHSDRTYEITAPADPAAEARVIALDILDSESGERMPARFSIRIDGEVWTPLSLNEHGIRFTSIHARKKQRETVLYSRGTGPVRFAVPDEAAKVDIHVARGLQYRPETIEIEAVARVSSKTGVEMEALVAVSTAALTIYDMCKSVDRAIVIEAIRLEEKSGGKSGHFTRTS
jgi:hypothetical protein